MAKADRATIRVEIAEQVLARLLSTGQVCAADFRCLDCKSKQCLWRLCLQSCAKSPHTGIPGISVRNDPYQGCGLCYGKNCERHG